MPNGGSDCCGTCWFNAKNKGQAGYDHANDPEPDHCQIRQLTIDDPFYTYCANHPRRRPDRDPVPIGPVFTAASGGERVVWKASPDTEEVRQHLLELLAEIQETSEPEYPSGSSVSEVVVWQLGEFRDERAMDGLNRVARFRTGAKWRDPLARRRDHLVRLAKEALRRIVGDQ